MIMTLLFLAQLLFFVELIFLGIADLKYRVAAAVEIFFFGSVLVAILYQAPILQVGAAALSVAYGAAILPSGFAVLLLLWPPTWPSLVVGYGVRKELLGKGDLFAIGGISALYSLDVAIAAIIGTMLWAKWWGNRYRKSGDGTTLIPLLPGMVIGVAVGMGFHLFLKSYFGV
jgi:hypothetical protein